MRARLKTTQRNFDIFVVFTVFLVFYLIKPKFKHEKDLNKLDCAELILRDFLVPPAPHDVPYNLTDPDNQDPSAGQAKIVTHLLDNMRDGFFVDYGARDGETISNTLFFERKLNWSGVLIEPDPQHTLQLLSKHRRAWVVTTCLRTHSNKGRECVVPLHAILLALNKTRVDFLSITARGEEMDILQSIPFQSIDIRVLAVEHVSNRDGRKQLINFMANQGYYNVVDSTMELPHDFVFIKQYN